jgi:hypothetical protein
MVVKLPLTIDFIVDDNNDYKYKWSNHKELELKDTILGTILTFLNELNTRKNVDDKIKFTTHSVFVPIITMINGIYGHNYLPYLQDPNYNKQSNLRKIQYKKTQTASNFADIDVLVRCMMIICFCRYELSRLIYDAEMTQQQGGRWAKHMRDYEAFRRLEELKFSLQSNKPFTERHFWNRLNSTNNIEQLLYILKRYYNSIYYDGTSIKKIKKNAAKFIIVTYKLQMLLYDEYKQYCSNTANKPNCDKYLRTDKSKNFFENISLNREDEYDMILYRRIMEIIKIRTQVPMQVLGQVHPGNTVQVHNIGMLQKPVQVQVPIGNMNQGQQVIQYSQEKICNNIIQFMIDGNQNNLIMPTQIAANEVHIFYEWVSKCINLYTSSLNKPSSSQYIVTIDALKTNYKDFMEHLRTNFLDKCRKNVTVPSAKPVVQPVQQVEPVTPQAPPRTTAPKTAPPKTPPRKEHSQTQNNTSNPVFEPITFASITKLMIDGIEDTSGLITAHNIIKAQLKVDSEGIYKDGTIDYFIKKCQAILDNNLITDPEFKKMATEYIIKFKTVNPDIMLMGGTPKKPTKNSRKAATKPRKTAAKGKI